MASGSNTTYKWDSFKSMPTKRVFSVAVELEDKLYVVGGCDQKGTPLDSFEVFNPKKKQWMMLAHMETKRAGTCAVVAGKKIFVFGGVAVNQQPLSSVEMYDTADGKQAKWVQLECLKDPLQGLSAVVRDNKIYVVGGMSLDTNPRDCLLCYDIELEQWKVLPSMPTARYATFSFIINDKLYVIGGRQGKLPVTAFEVYDFETEKWSKLPDVPTKRVFALYYSTNTHIYSMGGVKEDPRQGFSDAAEVFDVEKEEWTVCKPMPTKRGDFAIGFVSDRLVVAGGLGAEGILSAAESYNVSSDTWDKLPTLPTPHCSCAHIMYKERLYVVGGLSSHGLSGAIEALNPAKTT